MNREAKMKLSTHIVLIFLILSGGRQALAQARNEISFSAGVGSLQIIPDGGATPVYSFSYRRNITRHFSIEGSLDIFYYKFLTGPLNKQSVYKDDYLGAEAAVVYYFRPNREIGRLLPFVAAGIGKTSTDFTEIQAHPYYRFGAGFSYNLTEKWGLRFELRDEIVKSLYIHDSPTGNLPSARLGIVRRF
jgi:hypothetical protein